MTKLIDWERIDNSFICGASITQCAAGIGCSVATLERRCRSEKNAEIAHYQQEKREKGNLLIHAAQFDKAIKEKNPTMLIWLGKQRLGQKDAIDSGPNNDKELSAALLKIHSTDFDVMKIKINELEMIVEEYRKKELKLEVVERSEN